MSKVFRAVFQRTAQPAWPLPVGSRDVMPCGRTQGGGLAREVAAGFTARRILAFTDSIASVVQTMRRIPVPEANEGENSSQAFSQSLHHRIPPAGKTHVAQALGHLAIRLGAHVRFAKTSRILAELAGGHADRTWEKRMRELVRPDVLILDDFAMRQLTAAQADDLYELSANGRADP